MQLETEESEVRRVKEALRKNEAELLRQVRRVTSVQQLLVCAQVGHSEQMVTLTRLAMAESVRHSASL